MLFIWGFIFQILRPAKDQIIFLKSLDVSLGIFWGEKVAKYSYQNCASPFLQLRARPWVKQKMRAALIVR